MRYSAAAFGVLLGASITVEARAEGETINHVVQKGDTCASIAQKYYGDARLVDVLHKANPSFGNLPPPHNLVPGTIVIVPPKPGTTSAPDARLTTVRNKVDVLAPETRPGKPKDPLFRGNRVSTEASSSADVTFRDESQVNLGERTLVVILGDSHSAASKENTPAPIETQLVTGNLRAFMSQKSTAPIAVQTPSSAVKITGGEAQVAADEKKTTRLAVYAGKSTISASNVTRDVNLGFGSKAEVGKPPTVPKPLPPAPTWSKLPLRVLLDKGSGAPPIIGEYTGTQVHDWHVQVATDDKFHGIVTDTKVPASTTRFEGKMPNPGHYYLRVSAIDDDKFEGPYGDVARILVVKPTITAGDDTNHRTITLDPPDSPCMRVGNVRLTWVKAPIVAAKDEPVRLRCAPAESDPTTLVDIDRLDDFPSPN